MIGCIGWEWLGMWMAVEPPEKGKERENVRRLEGRESRQLSANLTLAFSLKRGDNRIIAPLPIGLFMDITKKTAQKIEQEYLVFLGDLYVSSENLPTDSVKWILSELAVTISVVHPDYHKSKVVDLLVNLQKLKRIGKKKIEI